MDSVEKATLEGWWAQARYFDNDNTSGTAAELVASVADDPPSETQFFWGTPPIDIYNSSELVLPDANGKIKFKVTGDDGQATVLHPAGGNVNIKEVRLHVYACDGAKACWENVVAQFHVSAGGFWQSWNQSGPRHDRQLGQQMPQPTPFPITPPLLQGGAYYNKVVFTGTIEFATDQDVHPGESELYAIVQVVPA